MIWKLFDILLCWLQWETYTSGWHTPTSTHTVDSILMRWMEKWCSLSVFSFCKLFFFFFIFIHFKPTINTVRGLGMLVTTPLSQSSQYNNSECVCMYVQYYPIWAPILSMAIRSARSRSGNIRPNFRLKDLATIAKLSFRDCVPSRVPITVYSTHVHQNRWLITLKLRWMRRLQLHGKSSDDIFSLRIFKVKCVCVWEGAWDVDALHINCEIIEFHRNS